MKQTYLRLTAKAVALLVAGGLLAACNQAAPPTGGGTTGGQQPAKEAKLPPVMNFASLDVGSANYLTHTALTHAISGRQKNTIRIIPSGSDIARLSMLNQNRVDFGVFGSVSAFEGVVFFAGGAELGPQPVRMAAPNFPATNTLIACAADIFGADKDRVMKGDVTKTVMDIPKNARFNYIENSFGFNQFTEAWLAYAGVVEKDINWVPVASFGSAARTVIEGRSDCYWTATNTAQNQDLASSPRGYAPIGLHKDAPTAQADAWKRLRAVNPEAVYGVATEGTPPTSTQIPNYGNNGQFAGIETKADRSPELVYAMAKALYEAYDDFKDAAPGIKGFRPEVAVERHLDSLVPYHDGLVAYLKEKGLWKDTNETHNQSLLKREKTLQRAWDRMLGEVSGKDVKKEDFEEKWMVIRAEEFKKDGINPYYEKVYWRLKTR